MVDGERLFCSLDTAIPLALIANELIANAVGHAFPPGIFQSAERSGSICAVMPTGRC